MAASPSTAAIPTATATATTATSGTDPDSGGTTVYVTSIATVTSTSTNPNVLGPLTTTFTAPTECSQQYWEWFSDGWDGPLMGQECAFGDEEVGYFANISCLPRVTRYSTTIFGSGSTAETASIVDAGYYSPGIACPAGYETACAVHADADGIPSALSTFTSFQFEYQPTALETVIGCCPPGYQCQTTSTSQWCQTIIDSTTQPLLSCVNVSNTAVASTTMFALPTTTTFSGEALTLTTLSMYALMIQLNYQSTDLSSTSPSSLSSTSPTSSTSPETTTGTSSGGGSSHKTTTIAVAIVVPCVALIAAGLAWFYYRKRYQARQSARASTSYYPDGSVPMEIAGKPAPFEVAGSVPGFEMAGSDPSMITHELYAGENTK